MTAAMTSVDKTELRIGILRADIDIAMREARLAGFLRDHIAEENLYRDVDMMMHEIWHLKTLMEWRASKAAGRPSRTPQETCQ